MKKSLLTLSILSVSLLASCAKSDAQLAFIKVKKAVNEAYIVKNWDSCSFAHLNAKKFAETISYAVTKEEVLKKGDVVALCFTFTTMTDQEMPSYATYNKVDGLVWGTSKNLDDATTYLATKAVYDLYVAGSETNPDIYTTGNLIKVKKA